MKTRKVNTRTFTVNLPLVMGVSILKTTILARNLAVMGAGCDGSQRTIPVETDDWSGPVNVSTT